MSGIEVSKPGYDVKSAGLKNLLLDSDYSMFKYHLDTIRSMTINAGDTTKLISFAHGLGYVPAFIGYIENSGFIFPLPNRTHQPFTGADENYYTYADATNVYIGWKSAYPYNEEAIHSDQIYYEFYYDGVGIVVGNAGGGGKSTAWRFSNVAVGQNQSIISANFEAIHCFSGPVPGDAKYRIFGIDEDNVGDVDLGKSKTDAYDARSQNLPGGFWNFGTDVVDQVREIIARGGWASGNRMGFILNDDGGDSGKYIGGTGETYGLLKIVKSGSKTVNFRIVVFKDKIA